MVVAVAGQFDHPTTAHNPTPLLLYPSTICATWTCHYLVPLDQPCIRIARAYCLPPLNYQQGNTSTSTRRKLLARTREMSGVITPELPTLSLPVAQAKISQPRTDTSGCVSRSTIVGVEDAVVGGDVASVVVGVGDAEALGMRVLIRAIGMYAMEIAGCMCVSRGRCVGDGNGHSVGWGGVRVDM